MAKTTHTNRGTCQACGSVQAVDNVTGLVAKHGYTVDSHYFNGVCQGAGKKPAEHDVTYTRSVIRFCVETAASHDDSVTDLKNGAYIPQTFTRWNPTKVVTHKSRNGHTYNTTGGDDVLPIEQASQGERAKAIALAIHEHEMHASGLRSHANGLTVNVLPRLGQPLFPALEVQKAERTAAKAKALEGVAFPTKQSRKDALDKLSRAYDKARNELQAMYLALPNSERTEAKTEVYYGPYQLNHWRAKHAEAALREFPQAREIVERINALVAQREVIKNTP